MHTADRVLCFYCHSDVAWLLPVDKEDSLGPMLTELRDAVSEVSIIQQRNVATDVAMAMHTFIRYRVVDILLSVCTVLCCTSPLKHAHMILLYYHAHRGYTVSTASVYTILCCTKSIEASINTHETAVPCTPYQAHALELYA